MTRGLEEVFRTNFVNEGRILHVKHPFAFSQNEQTYVLKWCTRSGRYGGGTYAHADIAFEFASWISPEFKLYLITDYQRLKLEERRATSLEWKVTRELSKINYLIHTDAVRNNLVPDEVDEVHCAMVYAQEADVLNVALFGCTASEWRESHPQASGNMRDHANMYQLIVLSLLLKHEAASRLLGSGD